MNRLLGRLAMYALPTSIKYAYVILSLALPKIQPCLMILDQWTSIR